jgi:hypothetical protein
MVAAINVSMQYNVSFPASLSEGKDVYFTVFNKDGSNYITRNKTGVRTFGGGCYGVLLTFYAEDNWAIVWDIDGTPYKAGEEICVYDYLRSIILNINSNVEFIKQVESGRWKLENNQMVFYKDDNVTEIMRFNLYNEHQNPATDTVYERRRI